MEIRVFNDCIGLILILLVNSINSTPYDGISNIHNESIEQIKNWISNVKDSINNRNCPYPMKKEPEDNDIFIQSIICGHPSARGDFSWDGKVSSNRGLFEGYGRIKFGVNGNKSNKRNCVQMGRSYENIFGGQIKEFYANFSNGNIIDYSTIETVIETKNKRTLKIEASVQRGALHGVYKLQDSESGKWGIGRVNIGKVDLTTCWIIDSEMVYYGSCEDFLTPRPKDEGFIFLDDFRLTIRGFLDLNSRTINRALISRIDFGAHNSSHCYVTVNGDKIYPYFSYSLDEKIRTYPEEADITQDEKLLCSAIDDRYIAQSIRSYFSTILSNFSKFFHFKSHKSSLDKKAIKLISRIDHVEENIYEAQFTFQRKTFSEFKYTGDLDGEGRFHGFGILELSDKNQCMRGKCSIPEINLISGFFRNGELEGSVYIISEDNIQGSAAVAVKGVLHGRVLTIGMKSHYPYPMAKNTINFNYNQVTMNGLGFYGYFLNGRASGTVWYGMVGHELNKQGLLYGKVDSKGKLSGSDISYIYPNHFNVLHGVFEDRIMKAAVYRHILELNCNKDSILEVKISGKPSNMETEQVYFYDPPSNTTLASPSMLIIEDPYEAETIYLSKSGIPNSGDGLHAKRDLEAGEVGAWYSGALFGEKEGNIWNNACRFNASLSAKSIAYCYKYRISTYHGALIDIPVDYDEESRYRSTLGHKMNNGFGNEVNTGFYQAEHPRFGTIVYILTTKPVPKGKELIVNYGYSRGLHHTVDQIFEWYFALEDEYNRKKEKERELNMASGFDTKPQI